MLGVSDKRVYAYIEEGRLQTVRAAHVIMIPLEALQQFKPKVSGRPRKNTPAWRTPARENRLITLSIFVPARKSWQKELENCLETLKQSGEHLFPGTFARSIIRSTTSPGNIEIMFVWRSTALPDETTREHDLEDLRQALADVLDWEYARYDYGEILLHT